MQAIKENDAIIYKQDRYGVHYAVRPRVGERRKGMRTKRDVTFLLTTKVGSSLILSSWIIRKDETFPRLTNAYPVKN